MPSDNPAHKSLREVEGYLEDALEAWRGDDHLGVGVYVQDAKMALERAQLEDVDNSEEDDATYVDGIKDTVMAEELYPRDELEQIALDDAEDELAKFGVSREDAELKWLMWEDGVVHYKFTHEDIPRMKVV